MYYSVLFLPPALARSLIAIIAWRNELLKLLGQSVDANVAAVKVNWWCEEHLRLQEGKPSHPVTQELHALREQLQISQQHQASLLAVLASCAASSAIKSSNDLERLRALAGADMMALACRLCGDDDESAQLIAARIGRNLVVLESYYWPQNNLPVTVAIQHQARAELAASLTDLRRCPPHFARFAGTIISIWLAMSRRAHAAHECGEQHLESISPLRKLWIAWRTSW